MVTWTRADRLDPVSGGKGELPGRFGDAFAESLMASVRTGMQRGQRLGDGTFGWNSLSKASAPLRTPRLPRCDVTHNHWLQ